MKEWSRTPLKQHINAQVNRKKQTEKPRQKSLAAAVTSSSHLKRRKCNCFLLICLALDIPSEIRQARMFSLALEHRAQRWKQRHERILSHAQTMRRVWQIVLNTSVCCVFACNQSVLQEVVCQANGGQRRQQLQKNCNCALSTWFSHGCLCAILAK